MIFDAKFDNFIILLNLRRLTVFIKVDISVDLVFRIHVFFSPALFRLKTSNRSVGGSAGHHSELNIKLKLRQ